MGEENKVRLHGTFMSPYSKRVELALRLKAVPYEFVEEDLKNKSRDLLKYNPVHEKIPVLVHNGKPICESSVIIEYIDETWKTGPRILPEDPYRRAKIRFWARYLQEHVFEVLLKVIKTQGDEQEKAHEELKEKLKVIEEEALEDISYEGKPEMGLADMVMCTMLSPYKAQEEVLGFKIVDPEAVPGVHSWIDAINEVDVVKELSPPHEKLVQIIRAFRQMSLSRS
ncbi:PREDICTED: glutathione S-transferase U9 [Tarenaya hassleriana]|uniref:glutathione S-transferase U9 n=1 Tax=Tarenaya hassleriana TaxID=28532 RepID=UPI00053CA6FD|nr:PREDICTED: glutathione S-transferase U9 [Tarenaya hassleriana]